MNENTLACVLAGGQSIRFNDDKSLFPYKGKPLIMHVIDAIRPAFQQIAIIADDTGKFAHIGIPVITDTIKGRGPLGGIYSALCHAEGMNAFVFACDMPDLSIGLIQYMLSLSPEYDVIIPKQGSFYEPLHAVYSARCLGPIKELLESGENRVVRFFGSVAVREVTEDEIRRFSDDPCRVFHNINYKKDIREV